MERIFFLLLMVCTITASAQIKPKQIKARAADEILVSEEKTPGKFRFQYRRVEDLITGISPIDSRIDSVWLISDTIFFRTVDITADTIISYDSLLLDLPDGPIGPAGPAGVDGNDGATGPMGPAGADGEDGATGPMGPAGVDGEDGATGPMGPAGADGEDGATGPMGPAGADGEDGATGPMGPAGADGEDGATGPMGPAGADGEDGATGPMGPAGADGEDGATGPMGPAGADGEDGATGPMGPAGADGEDGATGPMGPAGADGEDGATGPMGPAGVDAIPVISDATIDGDGSSENPLSVVDNRTTHANNAILFGNGSKEPISRLADFSYSRSEELLKLSANINPQMNIIDNTNGSSITLQAFNTAVFIGSDSDTNVSLVRNNAGKIVLGASTIRMPDYSSGFAKFSSDGTISSEPSISINDLSTTNIGYAIGDGSRLIFSTTIPATNTTGFAPVAISGDFNDLINRPPSTTYTASNAITKIGSNFKLGGLLSEETFIDLSNKNLYFDGSGDDTGNRLHINGTGLTATYQQDPSGTTFFDVRASGFTLFNTIGLAEIRTNNDDIELGGMIKITESTVETGSLSVNISGAGTIQIPLQDSKNASTIYMTPVNGPIVLGLEILDGTTQANYNGNKFRLINTHATESITFVANQATAPVGSKFAAGNTFVLGPGEMCHVFSNGTIWFSDDED